MESSLEKKRLPELYEAPLSKIIKLIAFDFLDTFADFTSTLSFVFSTSTFGFAAAFLTAAFFTGFASSPDVAFDVTMLSVMINTIPHLVEKCEKEGIFHPSQSQIFNY
jgi:hypothetical protein